MLTIIIFYKINKTGKSSFFSVFFFFFGKKITVENTRGKVLFAKFCLYGQQTAKLKKLRGNKA